MQTQTSNTLHNAIMEAGSKDHPPMLALDNYVQWKSRIKRYINTKPNHELIHHCLKNSPYKFTWADIEVLIFKGSLVTRTESHMEIYKTVLHDIRDQLNAEAKAVQIILIGIDNDIYSTVDACPNACEMWKAIERFYKMMNELIRNQCDVTNHQVNVQFLLQQQPEWKRFRTLVKQSQELKTVSYHKLYDILKQHQNEVNEIKAERIAQPSMVAEDDETSKDKEIDKLMALISLSFKKIYKPTNSLQTLSNTSRANKDNSLRINRNTTYENQRIGNIAGATETVGSTVVYYVEGLNHNLFSVYQFCDADLEVAFRKLTCYIRDLKGNDILTGSRGTDLYSITLQDTNCPNPICLMAKATSLQAWLWHRRLSHLNFDTINLLSNNDIVVSLPKLKFVKDHLCSSCSSKEDFKLKDGENLDKMKEKGNACIFVGYSTQSRAYRVFNKRTRVIVETIHVNFDKLPQMASDHVSSDPAPECQRMALEHDCLSPRIQCQENVTQADRTVKTLIDLDLLFSMMFDELLNGSSQNMNQAEMVEEYAQVENDKFINIFYTPVQDRGETLSRHIDSSNVHTFYQHHPSEHRWTKDHPLEQVIRNPSQSVRTRRQLESDGEMYMFALTEGVDFEESFAPVARLEAVSARYQAKPTEKHLTVVKRIFQYLKDTIHMGLWCLKDTGFKLTTFLDSDHAGCLDSRKSTSGGIQFLGGDKLVSWSSKKQDYYGFHFDKIPMYCDSKATISISCNPVHHSRTKYIDVRYHFIKEKVEKGIVELFFVGTEYQLADLFTKALPEERFKYLVRRLGVRCLTPAELEALENEFA
nr:retrovirus-related Pol polyprotein from transposon TNT 1-94 [Tanacetum cinerariifolium]